MNFGLLPSNIDLNMTLEDYSFSIALLGISCAVMFWVGFNNHT